jgi:hypothetical protein
MGLGLGNGLGFLKIKNKSKNVNDENNAKSLKHSLRKHLIDSAAISTESNPVFGLFEVFVSSLSIKTSLNARIIGTLTTFMGLGYVISKGRDISAKIFNIERKSEKIKVLHDFCYAFAFNFLVTPFTYMLSQYMANEPLNIKKALLAGIGASFLGAINGIPLGYSIDIFRDLFGIKTCEREIYKNIHIKKGQKKKIGYALILSSTASLAAIYGLKKLIE